MNSEFNKSLINNGQVFIEGEYDLKNIVSDFLGGTYSGNLYLQANNSQQLFDDFYRLFSIVEAAGGVVYNNSNEMLCIYRMNKWDLPKGKIEKGETIENAALREVEEETGISNLELLEKVTTTYHIYQSKYHNHKMVLKPTHWFKMKYSGMEELKPQFDEDITQARWISKQEIEAIKSETYASLVDLFVVD